MLLLRTREAILLAFALVLSACSNDPNPPPYEKTRADGKPWAVRYAALTADPKSLDPQVMYDVIDGPWWGDRPAVEVELTGPGGGTYQLGRGTPVGRAAVGAVAYMRALSGRDDAPAVTGDPVAAEAVASCRMPF